MGRADRLLEQFFDQLTPRQRFVVERSWGLGGSPAYSFRELAEAIGVDVAAVYRCYSAAMRRLRLAAQESGLDYQQLEGIRGSGDASYVEDHEVTPEILPQDYTDPDAVIWCLPPWERTSVGKVWR